MLDFLRKQDPQVLEGIQLELGRQRDKIELIASDCKRRAQSEPLQYMFGSQEGGYVSAYGACGVCFTT